MKLEYDLTVEDIVAFQMHFARHSRTARGARQRAVLWFGLSVTALLLVLGYRSLVPLVIAVSTVIVLYALALRFGYPWHIRRLVRKMLAEGRNRTLLARHRLRVDETGLVDTTEAGESRVTWSAIERLEDAPQHIYVYTGSSTAHVIPKRAFGSPSEGSDFLLLMKRLHVSPRA